MRLLHGQVDSENLPGVLLLHQLEGDRQDAAGGGRGRSRNKADTAVARGAAEAERGDVLQARRVVDEGGESLQGGPFAESLRGLFVSCRHATLVQRLELAIDDF